MTCIIAMKDPGDPNIVHIAADKAIVNSGIANSSGKKLVRFGSGLAVGFAGSLATQNKMVICPELINCDLASDASVASLLLAFQNVATVKVDGTANDTFWAVMLLAMKGNLVWMGNIGGWHRVADPVRATGEGEKVALGSWYERGDLGPEARLRQAIKVAGTFMPGVVSQNCDYDRT